jgi:hypothetical protein
MARGIVGYPATVSEWEMVTRGGCGEGENLTWSCREVQAAKGMVVGDPTPTNEERVPLLELMTETKH